MRGNQQWLAWQSLQLDQPALARTTLAQAARWLRQTARDHVPAVYQESFQARNPVNAALFSAARRLEP